MLYDALQSDRHLKSAPSREEHIRASPCNTLFPAPTRLSTANCISIGSAVFAQLMEESPYTSNNERYNAINARLEKSIVLQP